MNSAHGAGPTPAVDDLVYRGEMRIVGDLRHVEVSGDRICLGIEVTQVPRRGADVGGCPGVAWRVGRVRPDDGGDDVAVIDLREHQAYASWQRASPASPVGMAAGRSARGVGPAARMHVGPTLSGIELAGVVASRGGHHAAVGARRCDAVTPSP